MSSTSSRSFACRNSRNRIPARDAGAWRDAERRWRRSGRAPRRRSRLRARTTTRRRRIAAEHRPRPGPRAGSCRPPRPGERHEPRRRPARRRSRRAPRSRPTNDVTCTGRFPRNASSDRNGGNSRRQVGVRELEDPLGRARSRSRCSPRSTSSTRPAARRRRSSSVASDTTTCPPCADRHQPRRPVHRGAEVVAVAQLGRHRCAHPSAPAAARSRPTARRQRTLRRRPRAATASCALPRTPRARRHPSSSRPGRRGRRPQRAGSRRGAPTRPASRRDAPPTGASNPRDR